MTIHSSQGSTPHASRQITEEQFNQVIAAIIHGKYSWACVLLLRFVQCDPLHYIPYRTYNRLVKRNLDSTQARLNMSNRSPEQPQESVTRLGDLDYLEDMSSCPVSVKGGTRLWWVTGLHSCWCR